MKFTYKLFILAIVFTATACKSNNDLDVKFSKSILGEWQTSNPLPTDLTERKFNFYSNGRMTQTITFLRTDIEAEFVAESSWRIENQILISKLISLTPESAVKPGTITKQIILWVNEDQLSFSKSKKILGKSRILYRVNTKANKSLQRKF
jgi:hypothetical protein